MKTLRLRIERRETEVADYGVPDDFDEGVLAWALTHDLTDALPFEYEDVLLDNVLLAGNLIRSVDVETEDLAILGCELWGEDPPPNDRMGRLS